MRCNTRRRIAALSCAASLLMLLAATPARPETQTFELRPGWNAVFLEVQPESLDPAQVFRDAPIESAWAWLDRDSRVEFIQNPSEPTWGQPGWVVYFKPQNKAFLTNLYAVFANRAYLLNVTGDQTITWTVTGSPSLRETVWVPDSFNLVGFRVSREAPPSFAEYLGASPALAGQPVYRLTGQGSWELVADPATAIRAGEAYWVYCSGSTTFQGPLSVQLPFGDRLDYGTSVTELTVALANASTSAATVSFSLSPGSPVLAYRQYNASTGYFEWPLLATMAPLRLEAGRQANVRLAVRREAMPVGVVQGILTISDQAGTRVQVPVRAEKVQ